MKGEGGVAEPGLRRIEQDADEGVWVWSAPTKKVVLRVMVIRVCVGRWTVEGGVAAVLGRMERCLAGSVHLDSVGREVGANTDHLVTR